MASTISIPSLPSIQTNVAELAKHAVAVATAAVTDIEALQASNSGRDWKESVRLATAAALPANTRTGNVLLADANGALGNIDGVAAVAGDRILAKDEVTGANRGIFTIDSLGSGGSKWQMTRSTDADTSAEVTSGLVVEVEEGTANGGHVFELTTANPITLNTTSLTFGVFAPGLVQTTDARLPPTPTAAAKMIYDNGTAYVATVAGTAAQVPVINAGATAPVFVSLSGDATMTSTGVATVAKVNGATVPAAGALTTGNAAYVSGASALTYSALNLAGGAGWVTGALPAANMAAATAAAQGAVTLVQQMGLVRSARGVVLTNQANLAAFTVASDDGVTYIETDRVLLAGQTTAAEDGLYTVGVVGGGTAALTRATDYATGSVQPAGLQVHINEGTVFNHTIWFASLAGANTVGTNAPEFYPRRYVRITTAMAGTPGIKALSAEWILDATTSSATPTVIMPGTQGFLSIGALTPGDGDGSFTVTSTANETSTLQIVIEN